MATFDERRSLRANWPIRQFERGREPVVDPLDSTTIAERVALVWQLTREAWALSGVPVPDYRRCETPGKIVRREE
jgi:hypothetical protein